MNKKRKEEIVKKVTILIGSPRKNGSTDILAREAGRGLEDKGIDTTRVYLNDLKMRGCQACYYCKKHDVAECAVKDEMQQIHQLMKESDGIIVATPIYFSSVTAQTKAWLDRLFPYIGMDLTPKMSRTKRSRSSLPRTSRIPGCSRYILRHSCRWWG
jgi:multimeric flavodoxin WrbA